MKKIRFISLAAVLFFAAFFTACQEQVETPEMQDSILPERFGVEIPSSLSSNTMANARVSDIDTLQGNVIYEHLGNFINIGESAAIITGEIIHGIRRFQINKPMTLSYESDDDGRVKNLIVVENPEYDGETWEFQLTITDAENEGNPDGGKALQIFWNRQPIKGIAIIKPVNCNANETGDWAKAMFRIDYSEAGEHGYARHMLVTIADLPVVDPLDDPYALSALKMFVGKKGNHIDMYGNSEHPNATFFAGNAGFNWAFVATGLDEENIGVAEVGLPPSNLDEPGRDILLKYYAIKKVFTREIYDVWPEISQESIDAYLYNTEAPGYFDVHGFVQGGTSPGPEYDGLTSRLEYLSPYNPKDIKNLIVSFK